MLGTKLKANEMIQSHLRLSFPHWFSTCVRWSACWDLVGLTGLGSVLTFTSFTRVVLNSPVLYIRVPGKI